MSSPNNLVSLLLKKAFYLFVWIVLFVITIVIYALIFPQFQHAHNPYMSLYSPILLIDALINPNVKIYSYSWAMYIIPGGIFWLVSLYIVFVAKTKNNKK